MKTIITALLVIALSACSSPSSTERMESFVKDYLEKYPGATLQDIYKGSFQDKFGPAHLLTNREAVKNYILREMEQAGKLEGEDYQPCGWEGNFYQVNLSVIQDGKVTLDEFTDAFMAGANGIDTTLTTRWVEEWQALQQTVRRIAPSLEGFSEDSTRLSQLLKEGKYVVHHSRTFNQLYQPHYRIIRKDLFEQKILPKLK